MPSVQNVADLSDVFGLLGEPNRVRILISLLNGPMCVRDLAAAINLSESAVSHALRLLRTHRVVEVHRTGRVAHYEIADSHVRDLLELGLEHVGHTILIHVTAAETTRECAPETIPCDGQEIQKPQ
ncbi:ArsR/SmtB family transcription factor [Cryobacterium zhongshanensis]|uniref:Metalloregulator ArsR/SmtB family transcription factor n=1 Tax=Cryobacterium zhongshanensis TaxID=2928153 RepID=A0AA41UFD2_9MICO|nr:metalloregulator ArsR/SmtB family transcription factor [Cryobacterium zhongshanensis]MCI4658478.1 metalloregulator ArsR/SmtB family transcription factor [Cryobacterium zhongshanensis]